MKDEMLRYKIRVVPDGSGYVSVYLIGNSDSLCGTFSNEEEMFEVVKEVTGQLTRSCNITFVFGWRIT